jgi:hypothetical protein
VSLYKYLIQFLVLVSASLSLHSALALPLSSQLESKYHAVSQSNKNSNNLYSLVALNHFNYQQPPQLALANKLLLFIKEKRDNNLFFQVLLGEIITIAIQRQQQVTQSQVKHCYQTLCEAHLDILAHRNTLYSKKNSYQAKRQQQRSS